MAKIRRKRLFEDDFNTQAAQVQQVATQPAATQPAQPTTLPAAAQPAAQPAQPTTLPATTQQTQQPAAQPALQDQQQQLQQQLQLQQLQEVQQKVATILKNMENVYWTIANNVPLEIQKVLPDFTDKNQQAQPIIKLWNDFKNKPEQNTYNAFINAFKNYGVPQLTQQNVNASYKSDISFRQALRENLKKHQQEQEVINYVQYRNWFD